MKRKKVDWGEIRYLQNEAVTLEIEQRIAADDSAEGRRDSVRRRRQVKIHGSPLTPEFGP
jgi:hypothetical protein